MFGRTTTPRKKINPAPPQFLSRKITREKNPGDHRCVLGGIGRGGSSRRPTKKVQSRGKKGATSDSKATSPFDETRIGREGGRNTGGGWKLG